MKLMMKFCLCFHKITELWNLFSLAPVGNYFSVLFQAIIYVFSFKKCENDCRIEIAPSSIGFRLNDANQSVTSNKE